MLTLSRGGGIGGVIKASPSDFVVKEITENGTVLLPNREYTPAELGQQEAPEGRFTTFVLQKTNWNTIQALITIAKRLGHGKASIGYAGTKDRTAVSVQLASVFGTKPAQFAGLQVKDIKINGAWSSNGVKLGSNLGNSFEVRVSEPVNPENAEQIVSELNGRMPNYFDKQRFGSRLNNAKVGLKIMQGDFEGAAMKILTDSQGEENVEAVNARKRLNEEMNFAEAALFFPRYLSGERLMLNALGRNSKDFAAAIRKMPRGVTIMYIHAVEALLFNMALEKRIEKGDLDTNVYCDSNSYGFPETEKESGSGKFSLAPLIGYETKNEYMSEYDYLSLGALGVSKDDFLIKSMPELSMKGALRTLVSPVKDIKISADADALKVCFSLPSGSYATVFLNELTKKENLNLNDLH